tara:strand:+ start:114 stop:527 length:414 start_codon:yes stop_codon:yes gene_type:complete
MFNRNFFKFILIGSFGLLLGCVTGENSDNGFSKLKDGEISKFDNQNNGQVSPKKVEFFVVAKLKSVNKQPLEYLEFKEKRFLTKGDCHAWMNENYAMLNVSLRKHLLRRKKGYFVDVVSCHKTSGFIPKTNSVIYEI